MKIIDTLTRENKFDMLMGKPVGIFPSMILEDDLYYEFIKDLCLGYYTHRSGMKTLSPTYTLIQDIITEYGSEFGKFVPSGSDSFITFNDEVYNVIVTASIPNSEYIIGSLIRGKFKHKWDRIYNALIEEQYSVLNNREYTTDKKANNQDVTKYNSNIEDNGNTGTKITTDNTSDRDNKIYGFNSTTAVNDTEGSTTDSEVITGNSEDNTTHNLRKNTGDDTKNYTIDESISIKGRDREPSDLIMKELNLRNKQIFFDIIYGDIDSITALQIYI